jgi:hypothetical protein
MTDFGNTIFFNKIVPMVTPLKFHSPSKHSAMNELEFSKGRVTFTQYKPKEHKHCGIKFKDCVTLAIWKKIW